MKTKSKRTNETLVVYSAQIHIYHRGKQSHPNVCKDIIAIIYLHKI